MAFERLAREHGWSPCKDKHPTEWQKFIDRLPTGVETEKLQFRRLYKKDGWLAQMIIQQADVKSPGSPTAQIVQLRASNRGASECN